MSSDHSKIGAFSSFSALSLYRTVVGTPLDGLTKREILQNKSTQQVWKETSFKDLWKGFQPNALKFLSKTYVQVGSFYLASWGTPTSLDPALRGALIGVLSNGFETGVSNAWNVFVTRFIQGQGWRVLKEEGPSLLSKGLTPALMHRSLSGTLFWSVYEKLHHSFPDSPGLTGIGAGLVQVTLTSPFYIAIVLRQDKDSAQKPLRHLLVTAVKTRGLFWGIVGRGLLPRYAHSIATSAPLMILLEKYGVIRR